MLTAKQRKCLELMVSGDFTQREIAKKINVTEKSISTWKKQDEFTAEYEALLKKQIGSMAAKAFKTHTKLLNARSEMVRYMAAKDILYRAGYKPTDKLDVDSTDFELNITVDYGTEDGE